MRRFLTGAAGFVLGAIAGAFALLGIYLAATTFGGFHDFEGATAMGLVSLSPLAMLAGGIAGSILLLRATRPSSRGDNG